MLRRHTGCAPFRRSPPATLAGTWRHLVARPAQSVASCSSGTPIARRTNARRSRSSAPTEHRLSDATPDAIRTAVEAERSARGTGSLPQKGTSHGART